MFTEEVDPEDPKKALEIDLSKKMEQLQTELIREAPPLKITEEVMLDLRNRFEWHPPANDKIAKDHGKVRNSCLDLAITIKLLVPNGREQALALTHLEEVMMWANAGIARNS